MRPSTLLTTLASTATASARIIGIATPSTIQPGTPFTALVLTENYIQSVYDVAIAFGISANAGFPGSLGTVLTSTYLGPAESNTLKNISVPMTVPAQFQKGKATVAASLLSLYGVSSGPTLGSWNVSVTVGEETSQEYVSQTVYTQ